MRRRLIATAVATIWVLWANVFAQQGVELLSGPAEAERMRQLEQQPLTNADQEVFLIDGRIWMRNRGEREFHLGRVISSIEDDIRAKQQELWELHKYDEYDVTLDLRDPAMRSYAEGVGILLRPTVRERYYHAVMTKERIRDLSDRGIPYAVFPDFPEEAASVSVPDGMKSPREPRNPLDQQIFCETFEGDFPGSSWSVGDNNPTNGADYWDDLSCRSYNGGWSGWCADVGDMSDCVSYDDYMDAYMWTQNGINVSGYTNVQLSYWLWYSTESCCDFVQQYYWDGSAWVLGGQYSGNSGGWVHHVVNLIGFTTYYMYFNFFSDGSAHDYEGAYLDDICVTGDGVCNIVMTSGSFSPDPCRLDQSLNITANLVNNGNATCSNVEVRYYLSTDITFNTSDYYLGSDWVTLAPGGTITQSNDRVLSTVSGLTPGYYYVGVIMMNDNTYWYWLDQLQVTPALPDLQCLTPSGWDGPIVVSNVSGTHTQSSPIIGQTAYIDWAIVNSGAGGTGQPVDVRLLIDGTPVNNWQCAAISPSGNCSVQDWTYTFTSAGNHTLRLEIDYTNSITEANESNNWCECPVNVLAPDLQCFTPTGWDGPIIVSNVTGTHSQSPPVVDQTAYVDWAGVNSGGAAVQTQFRIRMLVDGSEWTWWQWNPPVNPGIPFGWEDALYTFTSEGIHSLRLEIDYLSSVTELNENNNWCEYSVNVQAPPNSPPLPPDGLNECFVVDPCSPIFRSTYRDTDGDQANAVFIEVGTSQGNSDLWSSGWTELNPPRSVGSICSLRYGGTILCLATQNFAYYWRTRYRDVANAEGDWSDWRTVTLHHYDVEDPDLLFDWREICGLPSSCEQRTRGRMESLGGEVYSVGGANPGSPNPPIDQTRMLRYSHAWNQWVNIPSGGLIARSEFSSTSRNVGGADYIYVVGGMIGAFPLNPTGSVQRFDGTSWAPRHDMDTGLHDHDGASAGTDYFIFGGLVTGAVPDGFEDFDTDGRVYNFAFDNWSTFSLPPAFGQRAAYCCVAIGEDIYILGGFGPEPGNPTYHVVQHGDIWRYSYYRPPSEQWHKFVSQMSVSRWNFIAFAYENHIVAMGGTGAEGQGTYEYFDLGDTTWHNPQSMNLPDVFALSRVADAVLNDTLHIVGGDGATQDKYIIARLLEIAPATPTNLTATTDLCYIRLDWNDNSTNEQGFQIYRDGQQIDQLGPNHSTYEDCPPSSEPYQYFVRAFNTAGPSESNPDWGSRILPPTAPTNVSATDGNCAIVMIAWDDIPDESGYHVYRDGTLASGDLPANSTSFMDIPPVGIHQYFVRSFNACGESGNSNTDDGSNTFPALQDVTILVSGQSLILNWSAHPCATSYRVYCSDNSPDGPFDVLLGETSSTSFQDNGSLMRFYIVEAVRSQQSRSDVQGIRSSERLK